MSVDIEQLTLKRRKWVQSNRENNFEAGIKRLLTELYPDNAHFIYELLQNAEDAGATVVRFTIDGLSGLDFEHNGERLFDLADVDAITSIGISTKRDDHTSIGKFGVGFKAVSAYTDTPEIHSGDFHFRIRDLVVPEGIAERKIGEQTLFTFPFDHQKKPAQQAVQEITHALKTLGDNTLLFLKSIRQIEYLLSPDEPVGYLERVEHSDGRIEISARRPGGEKVISHWLRFDKEVDVEDEDGEVKRCRIAIAYSLKKAEGKDPTEQIVPLDRGQVSIYFPADKETSNLRFHLHAPFASTVARDSVRSCPANHRLRDHLGGLVAQSLAAIRDQKLLSMGFLAVMPNPADNLPPFYEPIRDAVVSAFREQRLTPTKSKTHEAAQALYRGPARISEVLDESDVAVLTEREPRLWAANPPQENQREDRFLDSLQIAEWGWSQLASAMWLYSEKQRRVEHWISQKEDAWLMRFYALLGEAHDSHYATVHVSDCRIVRVRTEQGDSHLAPGAAFFPADDGTPPSSGICFVKPAVYDAGRSESQKKLARAFLEYAGVRPFDIKADIERRLDLYDATSSQVLDGYFGDLDLFVSFWEKHDSEASLFASHPFLIGIAGDAEMYWCRPSELYLDAPYVDTDLAELAPIHSKRALWTGYQEKLGKPLTKRLIKFLKAVGVMHELTVTLASPFQNPHKEQLLRDWTYGTRTSEYEIARDYLIGNLESYLSKTSVVSGRLIWQALIRAAPEVARAQYRPNSRYPIREADSQLVYHLKKNAWIPDKSGQFHKPEDMTADALCPGFRYDDQNGLLTAVGFGENAKKKSQEYQSQNQAAKKLGFDSREDAEKARQFLERCKESGIPIAELEAMLSRKLKKDRPEFPSRAAADPERRQKRLEEQMDDAPEKAYEQRKRSVRTTTEAIDPTEWLRNQYKNAKGQMICQICKEEMPFRKRDGEHYFEAVEVLTKDDLPKEHEAQYLALCPLCAAKYNELVKKDEDALDLFRSALIASEEAEVPLLLGTEMTSVGFVETHWRDIRTIVKKAG